MDDVPWRPEHSADDRVPHPTPIFESVTLATVRPPRLRAEVVNAVEAACGLGEHPSRLSTFQCETAARVVQSLVDTRCFVLADGTGTGKGRVLAATALTLHATYGSSVIWVSANRDMVHETRRDFAAVGGGEGLPPWVFFTSFAVFHQTMRVTAYPPGTPLVFVVDEAHMLRNRAVTNAALAEVRRSHPQAMTVLSSATPASCVAHLQYWAPLALWGSPHAAFDSFATFSHALARCGTGGFELIVAQLKAAGQYVSRHIGRHDVDVRLCTHHLTPEQRRLYDRCAAKLRDADVYGGTAHQTFFRRLLAAFKAETAVRETRRAVAEGKAVVISLQDTGQASQLRCIDVLAPTYVSSACEVFGTLTGFDATHWAEWPMDALDCLVHSLGAPNVAEVTGRSRRVVRRDDGALVYEYKPPIRAERTRFQSGEVDVAIVSRAGSTGIDLHACGDDRRRRVHIFVELPWDAETFHQGQGRTHRAGAASSPEFVFLEADVPCEQRFVQGLTHKLRGLSALAYGDCASVDGPVTHYWDCNAAVRREVSIRLIFAAVYDRLGRPRDAVVEAAHREGPRPAPAQLLQAHRSLVETAGSEAQQQDRLLQACVGVVRAVPQAAVWIGAVAWSRSTHHLFPVHIRAQIECVRMGARAPGSFLALLHSDLVDMVCSEVARGVLTLDETLEVEEALRRQGISVARLGAMPIQSLCNRMMGMNIGDQRAFSELLRQTLTPRPHLKRAVPLQEYVLRRVPHAGARVRIDRIEPAAVPGRTALSVVVDAPAPPPPPDPPYYWVRNVLCAAREHATCRRLQLCGDLYPSRTVPHEEWDVDVQAGRILREGDREVWLREQRRRSERLRRMVRGLSGRYLLSTTRAISDWHLSSGKVLRVGPPLVEQSEAFVGLLIHRE